MKRVLIFTTAYLPFVGGAEIAVKEITSRLSHDFEFDLITARIKRGLPSHERVGHVNVYRIGFGVPLLDKLMLPFLGVFKTRSLESERKYNYFWAVMVTYASGAAYISNILRKLIGKAEIPIVSTLQEGDSEAHMKYRWAGLIDLSWRLALRRTDKLTAISSYLLDRAKRLGFQGENHLVPNGVSIAVFQADFSGGEINLIKKKLNKAEKDIYLITTSRLVKKNAVGDIIEALQHLPEEVKFLILGSGLLEKNLKLKAKSLKLGSRVKFLGFVDQSEIPKYLRIADIFVRPSLSEGMGNSFIEAMAAGVPVVATSVGGITDFLFDPDENPNQPPTGLFCKPNDPKSIAKQVKRYLENPALRTQIILNAKKLVSEKYDWEKISQKMRELFS